MGGCQYNFTYGYYSAPLVRRVHPECGPRYGSFPLTVYLEDSLDSVSYGKVHASPSKQIVYEMRIVVLQVANVNL